MGIYYVKAAHGWQVRINGVKLGYYHHKEDALRAYEEGKKWLASLSQAR